MNGNKICPPSRTAAVPLPKVAADPRNPKDMANSLNHKAATRVSNPNKENPSVWQHVLTKKGKD